MGGDGSPLSGVVQLSLGKEHSCALISNGGVKCWGTGSDGQIGQGSRSRSPHATSVIKENGRELMGIVQVDAGAFHTCALSIKGRAYCWGYGAYGQLGHGLNTSLDYAVLILRSENRPDKNLTSITQISAGDSHTCTLLANGKVKCWGQGNLGQLGNELTETQSPYPVSVVEGNENSSRRTELTHIVRITASGRFTCAQTSDEKVKCWGDNEHGQLGNGSTGLPRAYANPVMARPSIGASPTPFSGLLQVSSGGHHSCLLNAEGRAWCWGRGNQGQIGHQETNVSQKYPIRVRAGESGSRKLKLNTELKGYACTPHLSEEFNCQLEVDL